MIFYIPIHRYVTVCLVCCSVFYLDNIAFISNIEKAFLQIFLHNNNKDFLLFLWFEDVENRNVTNIETVKFRMYRLYRVLFGASASPFLLKRTLIQHATEAATGCVLKNFANFTGKHLCWSLF